MAPKRDYYEVLGVSPSANRQEIRRAYRKKAFDNHPDRNKSPGAEDRLKEINEAYEVLSDDGKRAQCDLRSILNQGPGVYTVLVWGSVDGEEDVLISTYSMFYQVTPPETYG